MGTQAVGRSQYSSMPSGLLPSFGVLSGHLPALPLLLQGPLFLFLTPCEACVESDVGGETEIKGAAGDALQTRAQTQADVLLFLTVLGWLGSSRQLFSLTCQ